MITVCGHGRLSVVRMESEVMCTVLVCFGILFTLVSFVHVAHMAWIIACYIQFVVNGVLKLQCVEAEDRTMMKTRHSVWSTETIFLP